MKRVVYKETVIGLSWENKIDHFIAKMETKFPMDNDGLIRELTNNIMVRDMVLEFVFKITEDEKFKLFKQMNDLIEEVENEKKNEK